MTECYHKILAIFWIAFYTYWLISSFFVKKNIRLNPSHTLMRVLIIFFMGLLFFKTDELHRVISQKFMNPAIMLISLFVTSCGLGIAVWARLCLGSNWGMPGSIKEDPELITFGPYRCIRHPIYFGILLAILGTALTSMVFGLIVFVIMAIYFVYSARKEEKILIDQFPVKYSQYQKKTKVMIPFIW